MCIPSFAIVLNSRECIPFEPKCINTLISYLHVMIISHVFSYQEFFAFDFHLCKDKLEFQPCCLWYNLGLNLHTVSKVRRFDCSDFGLVTLYGITTTYLVVTTSLRGWFWICFHSMNKLNLFILFFHSQVQTSYFLMSKCIFQFWNYSIYIISSLALPPLSLPI